MTLLLLLYEGNDVDADSPTATHRMRDGGDTTWPPSGGYATK